MKKILAALVLLALVFGGASALEAALTVDLKSSLVTIETDSQQDKTTITSLDSASNYNDSAIDWNFTSDEGTYGGRITLNFQDYVGYPSLIWANNPGVYTASSAGSNATYGIAFANFTAWLKLGEWGKVQGGIFTSRNSPIRLEDLIDQQYLGVFAPQAADITSAYETDRLAGGSIANVLFDVYNLGPLTVQAGVAGTATGNDTLIFKGDEDRSGRNGQILTQAGARVSGTFLDDGLFVTATYRIIQQANDVKAAFGLDETAPAVTISRDGKQYRNNFGLYANITMIENLKLTAGYGFTALVFTPVEELYHPGNSTTYEISNKSAEFFNGIDLRAQYALSDTITLATHNNISFGKQSVLYTQKGGGYKETEAGLEYFTLYDEIAAGIGLTETLSVTAYVRNYLSQITTISKYDGKNPGDVADTANIYDTLRIGARLNYELNKNANVTVGFFGQGSFRTLKAPETETNALDGKSGGNLKTQGTYNYDPIGMFAFPVSIMVKF